MDKFYVGVIVYLIGLFICLLLIFLGVIPSLNFTRNKGDNLGATFFGTYFIGFILLGLGIVINNKMKTK